MAVYGSSLPRLCENPLSVVISSFVPVDDADTPGLLLSIFKISSSQTGELPIAC
ncbi:MAG: hypothetical protein ACJAWL_002055 [Motiliproteus sp.]